MCPTARAHLNSPTFFFFGLEAGRSAGRDVTSGDCDKERRRADRHFSAGKISISWFIIVLLTVINDLKFNTWELCYSWINTFFSASSTLSTRFTGDLSAFLAPAPSLCRVWVCSRSVSAGSLETGPPPEGREHRCSKTNKRLLAKPLMGRQEQTDVITLLLFEPGTPKDGRSSGSCVGSWSCWTTCSSDSLRFRAFLWAVTAA